MISHHFNSVTSNSSFLISFIFQFQHFNQLFLCSSNLSVGGYGYVHIHVTAHVYVLSHSRKLTLRFSMARIKTPVLPARDRLGDDHPILNSLSVRFHWTKHFITFAFILKPFLNGCAFPLNFSQNPCLEKVDNLSSLFNLIYITCIYCFPLLEQCKSLPMREFPHAG
ncbi:hypothetical protein BT69DRAFT_303137 [Atractiella rhizophila]|nr:hypothetical protein BT69DRAFT_303137 [Atractiella rhizophila]